MCGIVGYTGGRQAAPIILDGLGKLEYRGYDSAGVAVSDKDGTIDIVKRSFCNPDYIIGIHRVFC